MQPQEKLLNEVNESMATLSGQVRELQEAIKGGWNIDTLTLGRKHAIMARTCAQLSKLLSDSGCPELSTTCAELIAESNALNRNIDQRLAHLLAKSPIVPPPPG